MNITQCATLLCSQKQKGCRVKEMQIYKEKYQPSTGARRTSTLEINTAKKSWSPLISCGRRFAQEKQKRETLMTSLGPLLGLSCKYM